MISDKKRKWILGVLAAVLIAAPFVLLSGWTLDSIQEKVRVGVESGQVEPWMPLWQARVAYVYRYTMRDESSARAFRRYMRYFYDAEQRGDDSVARERAADAIYGYAGVLDDLNRRAEANWYLAIFLKDTPEHDDLKRAEARSYELQRTWGAPTQPPDEDD